MLTLKAPIQLHIAQNLTGNAEAFGERIRGNYGLLGAHFAAKDLLFLMTAPPELPEDLGGMTTLVNQQSTVDVRSVTMEVVNNVVNRILLDGTEQFTYQDQVYITTVLNRLGITNVAQFMEQVRQLRVENESTVHMTRLYREELERILQRQMAGESAPVLPLPAAKGEETPALARDPRVTLCMEILNRLETTNLYETVHAFQRSWTGGANLIRNQELKLSEQLRFSNAVSLAEIKQQIYQQPNLHLLHHLNAYETGNLLEVPKDEEEVLSQAAAAALMTAVDNTVVEVLNRPSFRQEQWVQVKNALWQVAENTLSRFETYHSQPQPSADLSVRADMAWNNYVQELKEYQTLYRQMYPKAADRLAPPLDRGEGGRTFLTHLAKLESTEETLLDRSTVLRETETEKHFTEDVLRENRQQILRELTGPAAAQPFGQDTALDAEALQLTYRSETREGDQLQYQENTEIIHTHGQPPAAAERAEAPERRIAEGEKPADRETLLRQERELASERLREIIQRQLQQQGNAPSAPLQGGVPMIPDLRREEPGDEEAGIVEKSFTERTEQEKHFTEDVLRENRQQILRELTGPAAQSFGGDTEPDTEALQLTYRSETREGDQVQYQENTEILHANGQQPPMAAEGAEAPAGRMAEGEKPADRETLLRQERERQLASERLREIIQRQLQQGSAPPVQMQGVVPMIPALRREEPGEEEAGTVEKSFLERTEREKRFIFEHSRESQQRTIQELLRTAGAMPGGTVVPPGDSWNVTHWNQTREGDLIHRWENGEHLTVEEQTAIRELVSVRELRRMWPPKPSAQTITLHREHAYREREQVVRESREKAVPLPVVREKVETAMPWLELRQRVEPQTVPPVQPVPLTPREAEEQAPEVLLEEMTRIDQHNRTVLQAVQAESRRKEMQIPTGPDIQRTMRDALRALNEPESVLREVYAQREEPVATEHPELTPREEALLRQAEPKERAVYEAVLAYQKDPEGALAKGLLKPGNLGVLHAELQKAAREEAPLELEHPGEEAQRQREWLREQSETVLERFHNLPVKPRSIVEETAPPPAVKIVHKQAAPDVTEELLEQLEEQRTRSTVHTDTHEEVTRRQSHQVDVNQMERKVVAQTTEDITELVNRTLARQMRTISDQVYRQMEKRLQAERSRRGRL